MTASRMVLSGIGLVLLALAVLMAGAAPSLAGPQPAASGGPAASPATPESPFACVPSALSPAERKQHFDEFGPKLRERLKAIHELSDGYEFEFAAEGKTYQMLATWMYQERLCCPFFDLSLRIDREGGPLSLRLSGRRGVKQFIAAEFEPWFSKMGDQPREGSAG